MKCKKNSKTLKSSWVIQVQVIKEDKAQLPVLVTEVNYPSVPFNSKPTWVRSTLQTLKNNPSQKYQLKKDTNSNCKPK